MLTACILLTMLVPITASVLLGSACVDVAPSRAARRESRSPRKDVGPHLLGAENVTGNRVK